MKLWFTQHAVERFRTRHAPTMSHRQALHHLIRAAESATMMRDNTALGQEQALISNPDCILVIKRDGNSARDNGRIPTVCVTVLPATIHEYEEEP